MRPDTISALRRCSRAALLVAALLGGLLAATAAPTAPAPDSEKLKPIGWPAKGGLKPAYRIVETTFDNYPVTQGHLSVPGLRLVTDLPYQWVNDATIDSPYALAFRAKPGTPLILGVSVFERDQLLPDTSANSWARYTEGRGLEHPDGFTILNESNSIDDPNGFGILDSPTREILFRYNRSGAPTLTEYQLFVWLDRQLWVFGLTGPEQYVRNAVDNLRLLVNQASKKRD